MSLHKLLRRTVNKYVDNYIEYIAGKKYDIKPEDLQVDWEVVSKLPASKKAESPYIAFCKTERPKIKSEFPNLSFGDVAKELGRRWKIHKQQNNLSSPPDRAETTDNVPPPRARPSVPDRAETTDNVRPPRARSSVLDRAETTDNVPLPRARPSVPDRAETTDNVSLSRARLSDIDLVQTESVPVVVIPTKESDTRQACDAEVVTKETKKKKTTKKSERNKTISPRKPQRPPYTKQALSELPRYVIKELAVQNKLPTSDDTSEMLETLYRFYDYDNLPPDNEMDDFDYDNSEIPLPYPPYFRSVIQHLDEGILRHLCKRHGIEIGTRPDMIDRLSTMHMHRVRDDD